MFQTTNQLPKSVPFCWWKLGSSRLHHAGGTWTSFPRGFPRGLDHHQYGYPYVSSILSIQKWCFKTKYHQQLQPVDLFLSKSGNTQIKPMVHYLIAPKTCRKKSSGNFTLCELEDGHRHRCYLPIQNSDFFPYVKIPEGSNKYNWLVALAILKNMISWEGLSHILWKIKNVRCNADVAPVWLQVDVKI